MDNLENIKILYIEDDEFIRKNAIEYLSYSYKNIYEAIDGVDGLKKYEQINPDIIICDIMMPKLNGIQLIEKIRKKDKSTQIIIATARIDTEFLIKAIELRLVKYITKPITEEKLLPAIKEAINFIKEDNSNILKLHEDFKFDMLNKVLMKDNKLIKLTKKELLFLEICAKNNKRAVTYSELENYIWQGYMTEDAIRSVVKELRRKLPKNSLENISGIGYKLNTL